MQCSAGGEACSACVAGIPVNLRVNENDVRADANTSRYQGRLRCLPNQARLDSDS
jgi:hypothetical protein